MSRARMFLLAVTGITLGLGALLIPSIGGAGTPDVLNNVPFTGKINQDSAEGVHNIQVICAHPVSDGPGYTGHAKGQLYAQFDPALVATGNTGASFHHMDVIYNGNAYLSIPRTQVSRPVALNIPELPCEGGDNITFQPKKANGENTKNGVPYLYSVSFTNSGSA